jgi:hypothetical protein
MRGWKIWYLMYRIVTRIEPGSMRQATTRGSSAVFRFWLLHAEVAWLTIW